MLPPPAILANRSWRGRANQPGPAFPQSPGIIIRNSLWRVFHRFPFIPTVLSMNCLHDTTFFNRNNKMISTGYSPIIFSAKK